MPDNLPIDYEMMLKQFVELKQASDNPISRMSTLAALLHNNMPQNSWTGFYLNDSDELVVGPFQGPIACLKLKKDTGVCWACYNQKKTIIVPNVHEFPGHIACDANSCSEIVIPCIDNNGNVAAVLDIDSHQYNAYSEIDADKLESIVAELY